MRIDVDPLDLTLTRMTPLQRTLVLSESVTGPLRTAGTFSLDLLAWLLAMLLAGAGWLVVIQLLRVGRWLFA